MTTARDPVRLEVFQHLFASIAEEMGVALMRSAFSPNIKERRDFSCAVFNARGEMIAQAAHLPVHLGSAPLSLQAAMDAIDFEPGDAVLLNDPFQGGTHLPDLTLVSPVFCGGSRPAFYCLNRAHHADVGGAFPGSMAPVGDVHGEGLRIPPVRWVRAGEVDSDVARLVLANMRVPREREGDLYAQLAANRIGGERIEQLVHEHGLSEVRARARDLLDWTEQLTRVLIADLPRRKVRFEDLLEPLAPGLAGTRIRLSLEAGPDGLTFDFTASDDQVVGPINTVRAVVLSAVFYVLRSLLPAGTPTNAGIMRPLSVHTRSGSVVDASYPMPVAAGNVETSQRLVDVLLGALAKLMPRRIPAASAGTMSNLTFGSTPDGAGPAFAYYETIAGGAGASASGPGSHALQTHMTNTRNTPIEALENELPVRILAYDVRRGSGGKGKHAGGDGVRKRLRFQAPARLGWVAERQSRGPFGAQGGKDGSVGVARVRGPREARDRTLGARASLSLEAQSEFECHTPGGGGFGRPR